MLSDYCMWNLWLCLSTLLWVKIMIRYNHNIEKHISSGERLVRWGNESKAPWASSWMNSPILSLLLPLWWNKFLCQTIGMKICVTCTFIRMKIKSFSCETFCTSTRSEKGANSNLEVEVRSACMDLSGNFVSFWLVCFDPVFFLKSLNVAATK